MGKKIINGVGDCRSARKIDKFAKENGLETRQAAGSHKVVYAKNEQGGQDGMTYYESEDISIGVAAKIFKFFKNHGLLCIIIAVIVWRLLQYNSMGII